MLSPNIALFLSLLLLYHFGYCCGKLKEFFKTIGSDSKSNLLLLRHECYPKPKKCSSALIVTPFLPHAGSLVLVAKLSLIYLYTF